jgi:hypothetical protein
VRISPPTSFSRAARLLEVLAEGDNRKSLTQVFEALLQPPEPVAHGFGLMLHKMAFGPKIL